MTSASPSQILPDDTELLRLATTPRRRLFPILNRASAFSPLIVICSVIPAFQLLMGPILNEEASLWGLRSLSAAQSTTAWEFLEPGSSEPGQPLIFQPPLAAWLNGTTIRAFGTMHPLATSLFSLIAVGCAVWLTTRMAWRIGGANTALVSALLISTHPQTLEMAITPTNAALGLCTMLATVYYFQRHLEGHSVQVSRNLIAASLTWGLAVLSVGPISFVIPLLFVLHSLNQREDNQPEHANPSIASQFLQSRTILRYTAFVLGIGLLLSGWWAIVLFISHGTQGFWPWMTCLPVECVSTGNGEWHCDLRPLLQPSMSEWFHQQSLLVAWMIVGLVRSWHVFCQPGSELIRRRFQLLLFWWVIAFVGRNLAEFAGTRTLANTEIWNLALLAPSVLLASVGIGTLIERAVSRRGEFLLLVLLASLTVERFTGSWLTGLAGGVIAAIVLIAAPMLVRSSNNTDYSWTEERWRQLMQFAVYGSLIVCLFMGLRYRCHSCDEEKRLTALRDRLKSLPEVRRISMIATRDPMPVTLRYLLRSRWPEAEVVTSEGWDTGLSEALNEESESPSSRFLILEWTRRDIRLSANLGQAWRVSPVVEPMRFNARRLAMALIEPRP